MDNRMSKVRLYGDTSGYVDLKAPDVANDVTITLPNESGPFATETYVDAAISNIPAPVQKIVQIVRVTDTVRRTTAAPASYVDAGISVSITPTSTDNHVIVMWTVRAQHSAGGTWNPVAFLRVLKNGVPIQGFEEARYDASQLSNGVGHYPMTIIGYDIPNTTSSVTYNTQFSASNGGTRFAAIENDLLTGALWAIEIVP
jgi:hypothetical protein